MANKTKIISFSAKCSDMFGATFYDDKGQEILEYDGYVPSFFPEQHYGDYVQFEIDVTTGKIVNWKATQKQIDEFVREKKGENDEG